MRFTARSGTGQALEPLPEQTNRTNSLSRRLSGTHARDAVRRQSPVANLLLAHAREPINLPQERRPGRPRPAPQIAAPQARARWPSSVTTRRGAQSRGVLLGERKCAYDRLSAWTNGAVALCVSRWPFRGCSSDRGAGRGKSSFGLLV